MERRAVGLEVGHRRGVERAAHFCGALIALKSATKLAQTRVELREAAVEPADREEYQPNGTLSQRFEWAKQTLSTAFRYESM